MTDGRKNLQDTSEKIQDLRLPNINPDSSLPKDFFNILVNDTGLLPKSFEGD